MGLFDTRDGYAGANILQVTDNIDDVIKQLAKLEPKVTNELVKETRNAMKKEVRNSRSRFKQMTPKKTGALRKSVKVKSRTKKGVTKVSLYWDSPYAGYVNFWRKSPHYQRVTSAYRANKAKLARDIEKSIIDTQASFFKRNGLRVK